MTSSYSTLLIVFSLVSGLLISGLNITAAICLMKEKHIGVILMLVGGVIALIMQIVSYVMPYFFKYSHPFDFNSVWLVQISLSFIGPLIFSIGLLLHALHQRGKANRIAELEAILNSRMND